MRFGWLVYLFPVLIFTSCSDGRQQTIPAQTEEKKTGKESHKPPSSFSDTILINPPAAAFYQPDSLQLKKIKAITDSIIFKSIMHESFYAMRNARIVLRKFYKKIHIVEVKKFRYLLFHRTDGQDIVIDLNALNDPAGLIIFDGHKAPRLSDMTNIETELGFYFSKNERGIQKLIN